MFSLLVNPSNPSAETFTRDLKAAATKLGRQLNVLKASTEEEINAALKEASQGAYKGIVETTTDPIVSSDIIGSTYSSIVDLSLTQVVGGNLVKVIAWYDNEFGYVNRLVEEAIMIGSVNH